MLRVMRNTDLVVHSSTDGSRAGHVVQVTRDVVQYRIPDNSSTAPSSSPSIPPTATNTPRNPISSDLRREFVVLSSESIAHGTVFGVGPVPVGTHEADPFGLMCTGASSAGTPLPPPVPPLHHGEDRGGSVASRRLINDHI